MPRVPRDLFGGDLLCANRDAVRYRHLKRALNAPDSRAVWCVRAGYGAIRLIAALGSLPRPQRRKLFIGYSDATTIHYFLNRHWRWPSLHGPLLDRLGLGLARAHEVAELHRVLFGEQSQVVFEGLVPLNAAARRRRAIEGSVFGGNLTVLQSVLGTPLQRGHRGILFLEDIGERGYRVDRMLQHLRQAGALRELQAIVFGAFLGGEEADGRNLTLAVSRRFAQEQEFPVFGGVAAGHGPKQRPVFFRTSAVLHGGRRGRLTISVPELARAPFKEASRR